MNPATPSPIPKPATTEKPAIEPHGFLRLTSQEAREKFYAALPTTKWWRGGKEKAADQGWVEIFQQDDWRCIYCSADLAASTDIIAESTEEHLVPRSLLEAMGLNPNNTYNMAGCCARCNTLKSDFVPPATDPCWERRKSYIAACSTFIETRRFENFKKYKSHIEAALEARARKRAALSKAHPPAE